MNYCKQNRRLLIISLICGLLVLSGCGTAYRSPSVQGADLSYLAMAGIGERYANIKENAVKSVADEPVSTLSIDVDTAAYANVRRFINHGQLPPVNAVRIEEMINYFDYSYRSPSDTTQPFSITSELGPTPWNSSSHLLHVGIKAYRPAPEEVPARNLVFLLDVSGSMATANKLGLLKKSLRLLVNQLSHQDRVSIVVYAGASGLVLPATPGHQRQRIFTALSELRAGGSTNGGEGIQLAYEVARENFIQGGVNRVILATDGDFNVGITGTNNLLSLIQQKKRSGVGLSVLGFGMGNYNDEMLEKISNAGDGHAAYIDSLHEAQKVLVNEIGSTLHTVARDAKIQIEFNPQQVSSYRLIGYENRLLRAEDFKNDRVDAGDVGAGHTVTALYEITLNPVLRYQSERSVSQYGNELGLMKLRYKLPEESFSREMMHPIMKEDAQAQLSNTSDNFRFSAAVAAFGQRLRNSQAVGDYSYAEIRQLAKNSRGEDVDAHRSEFLKLVSLTESLQQY